jgi:hypothetical protein
MNDYSTINKLNTAIAVINDARGSLTSLLYGDPEAGYKPSKEDSKSSIRRRLVVARQLLNEVNRELRG